jgi:putative ABC transport system permease protein
MFDRITRLGLASLFRQRLLTALAVLGIALGVAMVVGVRAASGSAQRSFEEATRSVAGRATHRIVADGPSGVPSSVFAALVTDGEVATGLSAAAPVLEAMGTIGTGEGRTTFRLLGIDPFVEAGLRPHLGAFTGGGGGGLQVDLTTFLTEPGAVCASVATLAEFGLDEGERFEVEIGGATRSLEVAGTIDPGGDRQLALGLQGMLIADLATATELTGRGGAGGGSVDRIDLEVRDESDAARIVAWLADREPGLRVEPVGVAAGRLREITRGFRLNLQALSLLSLFVGAFLIYSTMSFLVVRRRATFGVLRALGASRLRIGRLVLFEATVLGVVGTAIGLAAGVVLAHGLIGLVARVVRDHYGAIAGAEAVQVAFSDLAPAAVLGLGACLVSAAVPAWEACRTSPRDALLRSGLEGRVRRRLVPLAAGFALVAWVVAIGFARLGGDGLLAGYAVLFFALLGCALVAPLVTRTLLDVGGVVLGRIAGTPGRLAAAGAAGSLSRTAVAVAALMVALATTYGLGAMIGSFRQSLVDWLQQTLIADVYVSVPGPRTASGHVDMDPETAACVRATGGVDAVVSYRWIEARIAIGADAEQVVDASDPTVRLSAVDGIERIEDSFDLLGEAGPGAVAACLGVGGAPDGSILISEPLAFRLDLSAGERLPLATDRGVRSFAIAGVFRDYGTDRGYVMMPRAVYDEAFDDAGVSTMALFVAAGADPDQVAEDVRRRVVEAGGQVVDARATGELHRVSLEIFDRTFAVTGVLRVLATLVAFLGVWSALMALQIERQRESAVLRAIGASPRQVLAMVLSQSGLLGLCAGLCAIPTGALVAWIMAEVVNRRSFGWTLLDLAPFPVSAMVQTLALALGAALLAGAWPAWKLATQPTAAALRVE